ncbi:SHOCT domain-containing protein [Flavobacterium psychrophilum]|nr:SHOCT domain-containing protein [Flavobacterium psychrophilum]
MEKNVYEIIQDWHELLKNGTISEEEFIAKKRELLENGKSIVETIETVPLIITEKVSNNQYDYHEVIYEEESFMSKYKLFIILAVICSLIFGYYYYTENINNKEISEPTIGTYIINADENNLVHFHTEPDINTERNAYFNSRDTVYVSEIQNNFGYIEYENDRNQKSKGWIKLENMEYYQE